VRPRAWLALLIVLAVASLTPLAQASPADPTWVAGFWDDGDYDDVVLLVCATAAAVQSAPPAPDSRRVLVGTVPTADPGAPPFRAVAAVATRAPPRV
jgi:hypothetical protein